MKSERTFLIIFVMLVLISAVTLMLLNINPNFSITGFVAEGRLPTIGGDSGNWGSVLNTYLTQEHTAEGGHKNVTVQGSLDVDGDGNFTGNLNVTGNLTIGDKITFKLGEVIDNIVDGWIRITGNLNVTGNLTINGRVGIGTNNLTNELIIRGNISSVTPLINTELSETQGGISAGDVEGWHEIGATSEPGFEGAWANSGGGLSTAAFRKLPNGLVVIKGSVKSGNLGTIIFTLPVGYRPITTVDWGTIDGNNAVARIRAFSNGGVTQSSGTNAQVELNMIFFAEG